MSFICVVYGWGVTHRSRNYSKTAALPRPTPAWVTAHRALNLEHTAQPTGIPTGWRVSFPGASGAWNLFQAAGLVSVFIFFAAWCIWEFSLQLGFALLRGIPSFYCSPWQEGPSESGQFWGVCEALSALSSCFLQDRMFESWRKLVYNI